MYILYRLQQYKTGIFFGLLPIPVKVITFASEKTGIMIFSRTNYLIMLAGIALIVTGFFIMTMEKAEYGFGSLGLTIGPGFLMAGFLVEIYAILHKDKNPEKES